MKLAKYAQIVKREGYCTLYEVETGGAWLATRSAIYCAGDLPKIESDEQMRLVLDLSEKEWQRSATATMSMSATEMCWE